MVALAFISLAFISLSPPLSPALSPSLSPSLSSFPGFTSTLLCPLSQHERLIGRQTVEKSHYCRAHIIRNCASEQPLDANPVMLNVLSQLRKELPNIFSSENDDYSIYSPEVMFEDPLNKFTGTKQYISNINFLTRSPVFANARLDIHDARILQRFPNTVRTRWTLSMTLAALPWQPRVSFTGQSDYVVDIDTALVVRHIDYWDSLSDSKFFSFPAILDLLSQCRPRSPFGIGLVPSFDLLRRLPSFQIWRFHHDVLLVPTAPDSNHPPDVWKVSSNANVSEQSKVVRQVAVLPISAQSPTPHSIQESIHRLKYQIRDIKFAKPHSEPFCVCLSDSQTSLFHIWLPMSEVTTDVDE